MWSTCVRKELGLHNIVDLLWWFPGVTLQVMSQISHAKLTTSTQFTDLCWSLNGRKPNAEIKQKTLRDIPLTVLHSTQQHFYYSNPHCSTDVPNSGVQTSQLSPHPRNPSPLQSYHCTQPREYGVRHRVWTLGKRVWDLLERDEWNMVCGEWRGYWKAYRRLDYGETCKGNRIGASSLKKNGTMFNMEGGRRCESSYR